MKPRILFLAIVAFVVSFLIQGAHWSEAFACLPFLFGAVQLSVGARNNRLDSIETTLSTSPKLQIWSGSMPADCVTTDSGTKLAEITLPSDWMAAASGGTKAKSGTWSDVGLAAGSAGYFRIKPSSPTGTNAVVQGTVTATGGGGDMTLDNVSIAVGQAVTVNSFTLTDGNA